MEIKGKIIVVLPERGGVSQAGKEWMTQEYVLETEDRYPRKMSFSVFGAERIAQFNIQLGEKLTVMFDIDCKEYNGRWYNSITAYKVERRKRQPKQQHRPYHLHQATSSTNIRMTTCHSKKVKAESI